MPSGANLGYGRAVNIGVAMVGAARVLVCNADVVVGPGTLATLGGFLDDKPQVALVGPRIVDARGELYPSARRFPDLVESFGHGFLGQFWPGNPFSRRYRMTGWDHASAREVDWVSGACFLARREAWDAIGGFDRDFFMYMEDVDLCWRLRQAGWSVAYEPSASVVHIQGVSTDRHPYRMLFAHHVSLWRFARRTTVGWRRGPGTRAAGAGCEVGPDSGPATPERRARGQFTEAVRGESRRKVTYQVDMGKASSAKKVARAAGLGGSRAYGSRPPWGYYFAVFALVVLGVVGVYNSREYRQAKEASPAKIEPTRNMAAPWLEGYGVYVCGKFLPPIKTNKDPYGITTHGDGLIYINPNTLQASGHNATLFKFASSIGMTLNAAEIEEPGGKAYTAGDSCEGKPGNVYVMTWSNFTEPQSDGTLQNKKAIDNLNPHVREDTCNPDCDSGVLLEDKQLVTIAFLPAPGKGKTPYIPQPPASVIAHLQSLESTGGTTTTAAPTTTTAKSATTTTAKGASSKGATTTTSKGATTTTSKSTTTAAGTTTTTS